MKSRLFACLLVAACLLALPGAAGAQTGPGVPLTAPESQTVPPPGFTTTAKEAIAIAERTDAVADARREHGELEVVPYVWDGRRWQIDFNAGDLNQVEVDVSSSGEVVEVWEGMQARSYFLRDIGGLLDSPWLFLAFGLLFLAPFVDRRRPLRLLHLDLLVLLGFGLPFALLNLKQATLSTWAIYPLLGYLLVRMIQVGRGRVTRGPLVPWLPTAALVLGVVALVGARVALNLESDKVVDVGYASVVGADRILQGEELYVANDTHGDTYGPFSYIAYTPFERAFPWTGEWDYVPAAHAAAIAFDLLTLLALFVLGCQLRGGAGGRRLGLALMWAWAAFPLTLFGLLESTNDGLVAMLIAWALVGLSRPAVRGSLLGLAAAAKFFPAALIGMVWRGTGGRSPREMAISAAACGGVFALTVLVYLPDGGLKEFWDTTLGFQLDRPPDYSLWGVYGLRPLQIAAQAAALLLAVAVGFWPAGRRTLPQVAALGAAIALAVQMGAGHWFFFYVMWFTPLVLLALFGSHQPEEEPAPDAAPAERRVLVAA